MGQKFFTGSKSFVDAKTLLEQRALSDRLKKEEKKVGVKSLEPTVGAAQKNADKKNITEVTKAQEAAPEAVVATVVAASDADVEKREIADTQSDVPGESDSVTGSDGTGNPKGRPKKVQEAVVPSAPKRGQPNTNN